MLSVNRNKKAVKKFFKKMLGNPHVTTPSVMNVDKNPAFPPAHQELISSGGLSSTSKLRRVKYLNNVVENDHKSVKRKSRTKDGKVYIQKVKGYCCSSHCLYQKIADEENMLLDHLYSL